MSRDILSMSPKIKLNIYKFIFKILPHIPSPIAYFLGWIVGNAAWVLDNKGRRLVEYNLSKVINPSKQKKLKNITRKNYYNFIFTVIDQFRMHKKSNDFFSEKNLKIIDPANVLGNIRNKQHIALTIHCHWELCAAAAIKFCCFKNFAAIVLSQGNKECDKLFTSVREQVGMNSLFLEKAPLESLRYLKKGNTIGIAGDRLYSKSGIVMPVCNGKIELPVGPASLSIQTNAPIIPCIIARRNTREFSFFVHPMIKPNKTIPKKDEVQNIMKKLAEIYTLFISATPEQWVAFHKVWEEE